MVTTAMIKSTSVLRLLLLAVVVALVVSCNNDTDPAADVAGTVTVRDVANATPLTGPDARVDTLVLKYAAGDTFQYRAIQISTGGADTAFMEQRSTHVYTKRVKAVRGDGTFEIGMTFDTIKVDVVAKNNRTGAVLQEQHFTSADSAQRSNPAYAQFAALIGEEVTILLRPNATIQEISGVSSIVNKIIGKQQVPVDVQAQYARQIELAVYASFVEQEYLRFPVNGVDSTGGWSTSNSAPILNNVFVAKSTASYRIAGVKKVKGRRVADVAATLSGTVTTGDIPKGSTLRVTMGKSEITGSGRTIVDLDKGYTISKSTDLATDLQATITNTANAQSQKMAQRTTMRTTVELLR